MPAKTPMYLKTTTPKRGKKLKLRDVLTGDMISPPLGDVRHSAHVGSEGEGDMFGDVGFLHGKMDMLASLNRPQNGQGGRSNSMERCMDDSFASNPLSVHDYSYNGHHYHKSSTGMLKTTISMPVFVTHEQAPPKPPRLHLQDDPAPPSLPSQSHFNHVHHASQLMQPNDHTQNDTGNVHGHNHSNAHKQSSQSNGYNHNHPLFENGMVGRLASDPCRDISFSPTIHRLVPTSGSLSEVSSEDSMSETCGPLDPRRGLSLDSDAGLSNDEDLRSERSDSPCEPAMPLHCFSGPSSPSSSSPASGVTRSDSMTGLNLDLGPSILEDVLGIMDRYKAVDHRCEL